MAVSSPKVALVCLGDRKREVSFSGGYDSLLQKANETYVIVPVKRDLNAAICIVHNEPMYEISETS